MEDVVIVEALRTPIGRIGGIIKDIPAEELLKLVARELLCRTKIEPGILDQVIAGQVRQSSSPSNIARAAALLAGIPEETPAYTVHRQCGSGLQAIMDAWQMIRAGEAEVILAGGTESMSQSVYYLRNARDGLGTGNRLIGDSLTEGGPGAVPEGIYGNLPMGITAENLAERYKIPREAQDLFSLESQRRAMQAISEGRFATQIVPVPVTAAWGEEILFAVDEHPRPTSLEKLASLPAVFKKGGSVTAGNSSGRNDGAAAVLLMTAEKAKRLGLKPRARVISQGASGCDPAIMGIGPVESTRRALKKAGITLKDLDLIELNEAFAAQALAVIKEWENEGVASDELYAKINPNGGAIALGHPLGCTGAALVVKGLYELERVEAHRLGLITMCCAGGLGVALVMEKCQEGGR